MTISSYQLYRIFSFQLKEFHILKRSCHKNEEQNVVFSLKNNDLKKQELSKCFKTVSFKKAAEDSKKQLFLSKREKSSWSLRWAIW